MNTQIVTGLTEAGLAEAAAVLTDAFADYPVALSFTSRSLERMQAADDVVADACALARDDHNRLVGVCLAAQRGEVGRVAAMGVLREAHGQGLGRALGETVLGALGARGARRVVLEALTVNHPALALYERRLGFSRERRLIGFERSAGGPPISPSRWDEALGDDREPASWQLAAVVEIARHRDDLMSVPAVVPERHAVARLLRESGFAEAPVDQYELIHRVQDPANR